MSRLAVAASIATAVAVAASSPAVSQQPVAPLAYVQPLAPPGLRAIQNSLHRVGTYNGSADGVWGQDSQTALQQFQQTHSLQVTGQMNPATAQALGLDPARLLQIAPGQTEPPPIRLGAEVIRNMQGRLRGMGYYHGAIDGEWGPGMQSAVARLQQDRGLQPTGQLTPQTVSAMGLDPNNPGAPIP